MIQEKVDSTRQSGVMDIKTVNAVEKDNFMCVFNFPEDVYDSPWVRLQEKRTLEHQGTFLIDYRRVTHQRTIGTAAVVSTQLILVKQGALHSK